MASLSNQEIRRHLAGGDVAPHFLLHEVGVRRMQEALNTQSRNNPGTRPEKRVSAASEAQNDEGGRGSFARRHLPGTAPFGRSLRRSNRKTVVPLSFVTRPLGWRRRVGRPQRSNFLVDHGGS